MARKHSARRVRRTPEPVLGLPDLDQAKSAVLNSLSSNDAQRAYRHAIDGFHRLVVRVGNWLTPEQS